MKTMKILVPLALIILLVPLQALGLAQDRRDKEDWGQLSLQLRVPVLGGDIDNFGEKWTDYFDSTGIGFSIDGSRLWRMNRKIDFGIYASLSVDDFGGKTINAGGVDQRYDDLLMTRFVVGAKVRESFGKFFMEQQLGIGFGAYSAVSADVGGTSVGVIDSSTAFAFEMAARFGFVVSRVVDLGISLGYNYTGAPKVSGDLSAVLPSLKYEAQSNFVFGMFVDFNF